MEVSVVNPWLIHPCLFNKWKVVYILLETNITPKSFIVGRLVFSLLFFWDEPFFQVRSVSFREPFLSDRWVAGFGPSLNSRRYRQEKQDDLFIRSAFT